jgi:multidrug resistance efflux pump
LKADIQVTAEKIVKLKSQLEYSKYQQQLSQTLAQKGAGPEEDAQKWSAQVAADEAGIKEALAEEQRARLRYQSEIGGVNTTVAAVQAELDQARFYLDNTTMVAPEDGYIINLQVRPGMVAGDIRFGAIASFICDADRYLLATFFQENLKYVKPGQVVEAALDLYPGQIWRGKVEAIWQGSGSGQLLPSGTLPDFKYVPTQIPQGQFAVVIILDGPEQFKFPIGTQGRAAIYTSTTSGFAVLRRVDIRALHMVQLALSVLRLIEPRRGYV